MLLWLSISVTAPAVTGSPPSVTKKEGTSLLKNAALQECTHSPGTNSADSFSNSTAETCAEPKHTTRLSRG